MFAKHASALDVPDTYAFARFDTDESGGLAEELSITFLPTFLFFENGVQAFKIQGIKPDALKDAVEDLYTKAKNKSAVSAE